MKYLNDQGEFLIGKAVVHGLILVIAFGLLFGSWTTVGAGERGVMLTFGAFKGQVLEPGLNFKLPFVQHVIKVSVRTNKIEAEKSEAYSHDLQVVDIHSVINYNLDPQAVGIVYQKYGTDFENKILVPNLEASVKQTIAKYTAEELLSKRAEVQTQIELTLKQAVPPEFIVTKYALVNEAFSAEYEKAIESKQVAQQNAEKAKNELAKAQIDAESRVATAEGEAKAIAIQAQAIQQQGGKEYVNLKWVEKWDGKLPTTSLGNAMPLVNIGQ
jgi:regulator of protease activity HflC (stomatin/prohibitin superfamily)